MNTRIILTLLALAPVAAADTFPPFTADVPPGVVLMAEGYRMGVMVPSMDVPAVPESRPLREYLEKAGVCPRSGACRISTQMGIWTDAVEYGGSVARVQSRIVISRAGKSADIFLDVRKGEAELGRFGAWYRRNGVWEVSKDGDVLMRFLMDAQRVNK